MGELRERELWRHDAAAPSAATSDVLDGEGGAVLLLDPTGEVVHASPAARAVLGARSADVLGLSLVRFAVWADRPKVIAWLGGDRPEAELVFRVQRRRGLLGTALGFASRPSADDGDLMAIRLVEADEGDQPADDALALQRARLDAEELARRNDQLFDFAFAAAHDIRAPMMRIAAAGQGLARIAGADLNEPSQAMLGVLLNGIGELTGIVDAVLRCSQAGTGLRFEPIDCDELVVSVLRPLAARLGEVGASIEVSALGSVIADRDQVRSVLVNILENAVKYRSDDRPLRLVISSEEGANRRTICIADNGRGVDPEDRERVFRMFERLDTTSSGSGIGLATCHRVIDAHGGRIWMTGNELGGSSVMFTLPCQARTT